MRSVGGLFPASAGAIFVAAFWAFSGLEAQAQSSSAECRSNPHLSRAKDEYDRLEFDRAARTLQRAIEYSRNCRWDLAEIYRLKAFVDAVNGERERCQRAFEILLALDPEYTMASDVPPKIRDCFEDAARIPEERRELRVVHEPPRDVLPNAPVSIAIEVVDPLRLVDQVQVYFRREGVKIFTVVSARADETLSVLIPGLSVPPDENGYRMEYFIRAVDRWDGTLEEAGDPRRPLTFNVLPGSTGMPGLVGEWWFWVAVGAVVLGGTATAVFLAQRGRDEVSLTIKDGGAGGG